MPDFREAVRRSREGSRQSLAREADIVEELCSHLDERYRELRRAGLDAEDAYRGALDELRDDQGLAARLRAIERSAGSEPVPLGAPPGAGGAIRRFVDDLGADLRYGLRQLRLAPSFTLVAVLTLAVGVGANTAIFTQLNAVLFKPLPVRDPAALRRLEWMSPKRAFAAGGARSDLFRTSARDLFEYFSYPAYQFLRDRVAGFSDLACFADATVNLSIRTVAESTRVQLVSGNYFQMLGIDAAVGRTLTPGDDRPAAQAVALLSHRFWQRAFAGDASALGQTVSLNGESFVIVGVMPGGFYGADPRFSPDLVVPMAKHAVVTATANRLADHRDWTTVQIIGRLRQNTSDEQARLESEQLLIQAIRTDPPMQEYTSPRVHLYGLEHGIDVLRRQTSLFLNILMAVVGATLLIACSNIASLLLARATLRSREMATRLALGAQRGRLIRQLLTESLLLSGLGGILGVILAYAIGGFLPTPLTSPLSAARPAPAGVDLSPDVRVFLFAFGVTVATGLLFGLAPALRATRRDVIATMKQTRSDSGRRARSGGGLVVAQVALSLVLLIAASLFVRTLVNLRSEPLGFDPDGVLVFQVNPSLNGYRDRRLSDFFEEALARTGNVPGVISASMANPGVVSGAFSGTSVCAPDRQRDGEGDNAWMHRVAPRLFETMRIPLLVGRDLDWSDREDAPKVVIVNEAFANKFYPGLTPVGRTIGLGAATCNPAEMTIVGVAADTKYWTIRNPISPTIYLPYRQLNINGRAMTIALRSRSDPAPLLPAVRRAMLDLDPNVPMFQVSTQRDQIERGVQQEWVLTRLLVFFGLLALALAAIGIYGTLSYSVSRRTAEIGLRMAMGAERADVIGLVLRESLVPVAVGVLVGLAGAFAGTRLVRGILFGIAPNDPLTIAGAVSVLVTSAVIAASVPADRASRVDPMTALRNE